MLHVVLQVVYAVLAFIFGLVVFFTIVGYKAQQKENKKKKEILEKDTKLRKYLDDFGKEGNKLEIIDETPREVYIGNRYYVLKPLKYRQYTRICILFAKTLEKLQGLNIDISKADEEIGKIIEASEDDFFKAIAYVLYFSNHAKEDNDINIIKGAEAEFNYIKENATVTELSRIIEIVAIQNDIGRALKAFGLLNSKKKAAM